VLGDLDNWSSWAAVRRIRASAVRGSGRRPGFGPGAAESVDRPVANPGLVATTLASVLGFGIRSDDPVPGLIAALGDRRLLLVLDNCEHVIEAAATLAAAILRSTTGVGILATSREPLRVEGEHLQRLPPLSSGSPSNHLGAAEALAFPAVELFVERAAEPLGEFELTDEDAPVVAQVCRKLDGNRWRSNWPQPASRPSGRGG
jgi:predicted ATPase